MNGKGRQCWVATFAVAVWLVGSAAAEGITTAPVAGVPTADPTNGRFWPDLSWPTVCWFAVVVVLALTVLLTLRNLDGLVLAGMCLLVALRELGQWADGSTPTPPAWACLGLTVAVCYWLVRGIVLLLETKAAAPPTTVPEGVRLVLLLAGLALSIRQIASAPISDASRDGIVGGLYTAATGKLPYGDVPAYESRSPLLYLLHAGAVQLLPPTLIQPDTDEPEPMTWGNRDEWLPQPWHKHADLAAARLVNAFLFVLIFVALVIIGQRWAVAGGGWTLAALFAVFPGALECLPRPDIMLATTLLAWAVACALLSGVGLLFSTLCLVRAGAAWPWAWLLLPILLAYCYGRGAWAALAGSTGLLIGVAGCLFGIFALVQPSWPRAGGALTLADLPPAYTARLLERNTLIIDHRQSTEDQLTTPPLSRYLWRALLAGEPVALSSGSSADEDLQINWPNAVTGRAVLCRQIEPLGPALWPLQEQYRQAVANLPIWRRVVSEVRTVLEATWVPQVERPAPVVGAWQLWAGSPPWSAGWVWARRGVKLAAGLLVIWAALAVFLGGRTQKRHLVGALLMACCATLLASTAGATTNLIWPLPLIGTLWAIYQPPTVPRRIVAPATLPTVGPAAAPTPAEPGPPPRITVEPTPTLAELTADDPRGNEGT